MTTTMPMMPFLLMELPWELFVYVLTRLPLKYLMRLRCVSKFFLDLTNNPYFITSYRSSKSNPPPKNHHLPFNFMETSPPPPSSPVRLWRIHMLFKGSNYIYIQKRHELIPFHCPNDKRLINSINGLVCFGGIDSLEIYNIFAGTNYYLIVNPPILGHTSSFYKPPSPKFVFGYDPISNDYKILRIEHSNWWLIYSFGTNSWKPMTYYGDYFNFYLNTEGGRSICINGVIYWASGCPREYRYHEKILMFDLHKEKFKLIKLPNEDLLLSSQYADIQLLSFRRCLAFAFIRRTSTKSREELILGERGGGGGGEGEQATSHGDGEIWVELYTLKRKKLWYTQSFVVPIHSPTKEDEVEIVSCRDEIFLGWFESNQLRLYNLHTKHIFNLPLSTSPSHYYPKVSFMEKKDNPTYVDNLSFDFSLI